MYEICIFFLIRWGYNNWISKWTISGKVNRRSTCKENCKSHVKFILCGGGDIFPGTGEGIFLRRLYPIFISDQVFKQYLTKICLLIDTNLISIWPIFGSILLVLDQYLVSIWSAFDQYLVEFEQFLINILKEFDKYQRYV